MIAVEHVVDKNDAFTGHIDRDVAATHALRPGDYVQVVLQLVDLEHRARRLVLVVGEPKPSQQKDSRTNAQDQGSSHFDDYIILDT